MPDYRCPKHDRIFTSTTDHRPPGSPAKGSFAAHPVGGHPDCELCQADGVTGLTGVPVSRSSNFNPVNAQAPGKPVSSEAPYFNPVAAKRVSNR